MIEKWYYASQGQQLGPVAVDYLKRLLAEGHLSAQDLVWKEGMPDWVPAGECPELRPSGPPPLPKPRDSGLPPPLRAPGAGSTPSPSRTRRFEGVPPGQPSSPSAAVPQGTSTPFPTAPSASTPSPSATPAAPSVPRSAVRPARAPLSVSDTLVATFVLAGALVLTVIAGHGGSPRASLIFLFIALIANVSFWVRLSIFLYRAWNILPPKNRTMDPLWAALSIYIPLANLVLVFRSIPGLSKATNEALAERGEGPSAPEALGTALAVAFVLITVLPLALPNPGALLLLSVAAAAVGWHWLDRQCEASNVYLGHAKGRTTPQGLRIAVLATGALALPLAVAVAIAGIKGGAGAAAFRPLLGGPGQSEILDLARQEAERNAAFAEQLQNIRTAYSGGQIYWRYPPQNGDEARLRTLIEQEAARNREFLDELQRIRRTRTPY